MYEEKQECLSPLQQQKITIGTVKHKKTYDSGNKKEPLEKKKKQKEEKQIGQSKITY